MNCKIDNCTKPVHNKSMNVCNVHYHRWYRNKSFDINPEWPNLKKGKPHLTKSGYNRISINGKRVLEHTYIMQQYLGRKLTKNERVHHKNHIRNDNRIENLELFKSHSQHIISHHLKKPLIDWSKINVPQRSNRWYPRKYTKCLIEDCTDKIKARSLCFKHFLSWRRHGNY